MQIGKRLINIISKAEDIAFPHNACAFCGRESPDGGVCNSCKQYLILPPYCKRCGEHISDGNLCAECKGETRAFEQNCSVIRYNSCTSSAIVGLKDRYKKYLAIDFATLLFEKFLAQDWQIDVVCSVPVHATKLKKRGYNHSELIAREFCKLSGLVYADILVKTKISSEQKWLSREQRLSNLQGTIAAGDRWAAKGKNVLVIDDVFTTGSTMQVCAKALKRAGAKKVYCLTVAKTLYNSDK